MKKQKDSSEFRPSSESEVGRMIKRLKRAMESRGESARSLSEAIGASKGTVSTYLTGKSEPGFTYFVAMAKKLDIRVEWLATGKGPMRYSSDEHSRSSEGREIYGSNELNVDLLESIIRGIEAGLERASVHMEIGVRANLIAESYKERIKIKHIEKGQRPNNGIQKDIE